MNCFSCNYLWTFVPKLVVIELSCVTILLSFLPSLGVETYDIDLKEQKVTVKGNVQPEAVLQTVSKTGKKTSFWEAEAPAASEEKPAEAVAAA